MRASKFSWVFQVGMFGLFGLVSSVALAESVASVKSVDEAVSVKPADEIVRIKKLISIGNMMDGLVAARKLALQDYAPAQVVLGEFLDGADEDEEAVGWYMMAAHQGDVDGEFGLGNMYLKGEGVKRNPEKALYWIKQAYDKGQMNAIRVMAAAYKMGPSRSHLPVEIDLKLAKTLEEKIKAADTEAKKLADEAARRPEKEK